MTKPTKSRSKKSPEDARMEAARKFAIEAARLAATTRCSSVVVLDVHRLSPVTDFFVLATGTSARQMRTVVDELAELGQAHKYAPNSVSGYESETWILLDCVDVIVHLFNDESRRYYDLDNLWGDAKKIDWEVKSRASTADKTMDG